MVKCKFEHGGYCCNCGAMQYMDKCEKPCDTIEPISNADRIRSMSDEELATDMLDVFEEICEDGVPSKEWMMMWLKLPVKDGEDDGESAD